MAPYGRRSLPSDVDGFRASARQNLSEEAWDFTSSEGRSGESEEHFADEDDEIEDANSEAPSQNLLASGDFQQALHPLRAMAERVGREVEEFAEKLDRHNASRKRDPVEKYNCAFKLVNSYQLFAEETVKRLQKQHEPKRQREIDKKWRHRVQDIQLTQQDVDFDDGISEESNEIDGYGDIALQTTVDDLKHWQEEAYTWRLLEIMLQTDYPEPGKTKQEAKKNRLDSLGAVNKYSSEELLWKRFLIEDELAQERQTILQWLKDTAESSGPDIEKVVEQLEVGAERGRGLWAHGWLHTKEATKAQKRLRAWPQTLDPESPGIATSHLNLDKTEGLVTQLDPDAATRQGKVLEKQDQYFERAIWLACWEMIRRGKSWHEVREWCTERVEGWRSVSMRGYVAAWDQCIDGRKQLALGEDVEESAFGGGQDKSLASEISGNRSRPLWRRMCFALARSGGLDDYERAVYGILGGDVQSVEKVCRTWDDYLFTHYNSLLLSQFDDYLQSNYPNRVNTALAQKFGVFDSVQFHGEPSAVGRHLVEKLKAHETTMADAKLPLKMIQGVLIAKQFGSFAYQQGLALSKHANTGTSSKIIPPIDNVTVEDTTTAFIAAQDHDALRVITHMLLIFQDLGLTIGHGTRQVAIENIIVAYIEFLRLAGKRELIPLYASRLSRERSILTLGRVLIDITNATERKEQIQLMKELDIDVVAALSMQLRLILEDKKTRDETEAGFTGVQILEDEPSVEQLGKQIKRNFMGKSVSDDEDLIIRSFEWYMLLDGHWTETFAVGAMLYKRFLRLGQLAAARALAKRVPFSSISLEKTAQLLGRRVDVGMSSENSDDEEDVNLGGSRMTRLRQQQYEKRQQRHASHMRTKAKREVLRRQARTYRELETLVLALDALDGWRGVADEQKSHKKDPQAAKIWRRELQRTFEYILAAVEPLLHGWLVHPMDDTEAAEVEKIRNSYLPEVVLAYHTVLHCAGHYLSRENLLRSMDLATVIAAEDSDLAPCFTAAGRMKELVDAMALTSKAILRANETGNSRINKRKKAGSGANLAIWKVDMRSST
ncbi:MAG: Nucleoporin nup84 [Candelina submexicana]|nr:MAG: Nucleoporin nup84 [Candelina submexicana]